MQDIKELTLGELERALKNWNKPTFHAKQIFSWIYKKGIRDFELMSNLPSALRKRLKENFSIYNLKLAKILESMDGTQKSLFELKDRNFIEAVMIPTKKRITGCISTQVGCKFACRFCASGLLGFKRNLTCGEMIEEILYLKKSFEEHLSNADTRRLHADVRRFRGDNLRESVLDLRKSAFKILTHLVLMGIGEPLDNYDNVLKAIRIINSPYAFNIGARRITISTCGIIPGIKRLANENLQIELSVSLHAGDDKTRALLMPVNKKYPLKDLIPACKEYVKKTNRQITFEYVLIKGMNSDLPSAKNLSKILKNLRLCKVNLILANPVKELKIEPPDKLETLLFRDYLLKSGINVTLRKPRGEDIQAACGQLRLRYEKSQITQI